MLTSGWYASSTVWLQALKQFGKELGTERWEKVAGVVPGKTKAQCFKRFKVGHLPEHCFGINVPPSLPCFGACYCLLLASCLLPWGPR